MNGIGRVRDAMIFGIIAGLILSFTKSVNSTNLIQIITMLSVAMVLSYAINKSFIKGQLGGFIGGFATGATIGQMI